MSPTLVQGGAAPRRVTDASPAPTVLRRPEHTIEIVSDPGEGAQRCGQIFGAVSAKMGNGVWTVEIIPAEIQPPPRIPEGASGYRIRIGAGPVTNWGDETHLVVAFNEQVLLSRHRLGALAPDATILLEDSWASHAFDTVNMGETAPLGPAADRAKVEAMKLLKAPNVRAELAAAPEVLEKVRGLMAAA